MPDVKVGYEVDTGEQVDVPVKHTFFSGITRHGKTEAIKAMAERVAEEGYRVVLFDVKSQKRDYDDIGSEIPVYFDEVANPSTIKSLLETVVDASVSVDFAELVKVCDRGEGYETVLSNVRAAMKEDQHPVAENKLLVIEHLLERLVEDMGEVEITDTLDLHAGVNVMDLSDVRDPVQQIAISSTVSEILSSESDVIIGLDEAHNFIPQRSAPPSKTAIDDVTREGAAAGVWLWVADQNITGVDKSPLKNVDVWLLGKQREVNEADRVLKQVPGSTSYSSSDVTTLGKGRFIVGLDRAQPLTYAQPRWLTSDESVSVAVGEADVADVADEQEEDMGELEQELQQKNDRIRELESSLEDKQAEIDDLRDTVDRLEGLIEDREDDGSTEEFERVPDSVQRSEVREIVREEIQHMDLGGGGPRRSVEDVHDVILDDFQQDAVDRIMADVDDLTNKQRELVAFIEARGARVNSRKQWVRDALGRGTGSDDYEQMEELVDRGFVRLDDSKVYPNTRSLVESELSAYDADSAIIDETYQDVLARLGGEVIEA